MRRVPRELFVDEDQRDRAYEDVALSIGEGQTISQPFIVALTMQALELTGTEIVLEVGTGSGYQAAVLAQLCDRVVTVERIPALEVRARARLRLLGYDNVEVRLAAPGNPLGWSAAAPYDAIAVAAAAPQVPASLLAQLRPEGRLVIPVGGRDEQELLQVRASSDGGLISHRLSQCRFVPLIGRDAWKTPSEAASEAERPQEADEARRVN